MTEGITSRRLRHKNLADKAVPITTSTTRKSVALRSKSSKLITNFPLYRIETALLAKNLKRTKKDELWPTNQQGTLLLHRNHNSKDLPYA
ncbi:unnamed protein product [Hymenolepis diminuta]|uniref:Uncharacterized protein n=1 Tax=Hymenolepis diminuta TaxID=6216 RepID=A0A564YU94_HYMDI|nr:unnamed protein product [Hymenolepis diminuta]